MSAACLAIKRYMMLNSYSCSSIQLVALIKGQPAHSTAGPPGSAFDLLHTPLVVGLSLTLLAHPLAPQVDLSTADHPATQPILAQGHVVAVAPSGDLAAADYHGGKQHRVLLPRLQIWHVCLLSVKQF